MGFSTFPEHFPLVLPDRNRYKSFQSLVEKIRAHADLHGQFQTRIVDAWMQVAEKNLLPINSCAIENRDMPSELNDDELEDVSGGA